MQRYKILHRTYYNFTDLVRLEPHTLRLRPREDHGLRIESSTLKITPQATLRWYRDVEGNSIAIATFGSSTQQLFIESETIIQQYNESPLDFLIDHYAIDYPFSYQQNEKDLLLPYTTCSEYNSGNILSEWISSFRNLGEQIQTYTLLERINIHINQTLLYKSREEPGIQTPEETLLYGSGSCRDFAKLFMEVVRFFGIASRFVSGYVYTPQTFDYGATHAWSEVFLPGAGWIGFDPTIGKVAGPDHIAVSISSIPESVPPISGYYTGNSDSSLFVGVWVTRLD